MTKTLEPLPPRRTRLEEAHFEGCARRVQRHTMIALQLAETMDDLEREAVMTALLEVGERLLVERGSRDAVVSYVATVGALVGHVDASQRLRAEMGLI